MPDFLALKFPSEEADSYLIPENRNTINSFFYKGGAYDKLRESSTYFLVGGKGSGKTAYSAYFCSRAIEGGIKSKYYQIHVDDYNKIIQMKKEGKLTYTDYVTLWKAALLIKLCASLDKTEISLRGKFGFLKIENLLNKYNFTRFTEDTFSPISYMDSSEFVESGRLKAAKGGIEPNVGYSKKKNEQVTMQKSIYVDEWVRFINEISQEIERIRLSNTHYLFVDGIDIRPQNIEFESYSECVYSLIRAVYDINFSILSKIKDRKKGRLQIIVLTRLDIFLHSGLSNPECKLHDNSAYLDWYTSEKKEEYRYSDLYGVVNNFLGAGNGEDKWRDYFGFSINRGNQSLDSFVYFLRLTTQKPRDYVKLLSIIQGICKKKNIAPSNAIVESDDFQKQYSSYFVGRIKTALSFRYDDVAIECLFSYLRTIGKHTLKLRELKNKYNGFHKKAVLESYFEDYNGVMKVLFDNDMIGIHEGNGIYRWKFKEIKESIYEYEYPIERINDNTEIRFNWALEKSFSLYTLM